MTAATTEAKTSIGQKPTAVRVDIQVLRAIAVGLVVANHASAGAVPGGYVGVDVFFVISGFLITSHLLKKPPRTARDLGMFWARRIRRLFPAALLVLTVTLVATRLIAPATRWADTAWQAIASTVYVQNWALAADSVDYLAAENAPSPVQHYWSLSVEEQFYLLWPVLILAVTALAVKYRVSSLRLTLAAITLITVASLAFSVWWTGQSAVSAYFITPTRMWELGVGGLVAGLVTRTPPGRWAAVLSWVGIGGIVITALTFGPTTAFPGWVALLPVLSTALVIGAAADGPRGAGSVLGRRPVVWLGDVSYSVYLWHWPLIVLVPFVSGGSRDVLDTVAVLVATLVLAGLTQKFVEDRFRGLGTPPRLWPAYRLGAALMAVTLVLALVQKFELSWRESSSGTRLAAAVAADTKCFGADALVRGAKACAPQKNGPLVPSPEFAINDKSDASGDGCLSNSPYRDQKTCTYGNGPIKVALVGNSHAGMYVPALQALARKHGWTITTYLVSVCNATDARLNLDPVRKIENCLDWGKWAMAETKGKKYDLVVTSQRQSVSVAGYSYKASEAPAKKGYASFLRRWVRGGTPIVVLQDNPTPLNGDVTPPTCLAEHANDRAACDGTPRSWYQYDPLYDAALANPDVATVPTERFYCTATTCSSVIGGVVAYLDATHITATYATTLAPLLEQPLLKLVNGL